MRAVNVLVNEPYCMNYKCCIVHTVVCVARVQLRIFFLFIFIEFTMCVLCAHLVFDENGLLKKNERMERSEYSLLKQHMLPA